MASHKRQEPGILIVGMGSNVQDRAVHPQSPNFFADLITGPSGTIAKATLCLSTKWKCQQNKQEPSDPEPGPAPTVGASCLPQLFALLSGRDQGSGCFVPGLHVFGDIARITLVPIRILGLAFDPSLISVLSSQSEFSPRCMHPGQNPARVKMFAVQAHRLLG
jgi:hypothetical protein